MDMKSHMRPTRGLVPIKEAAAYAGLSVKTIRRYVIDGRITGYRIGPKLIKIDLDEIDSLISPVAATGRA